MSKKLEDFVRDNKSEFDDKVPTDKIWENIKRNLDSKEEDDDEASNNHQINHLEKPKS